MKILVPIKRVVDHSIKPRPAPDGRSMETAGLKHAINPFDEIALEEALRLKEKGQASEVLIATIGAKTSQDILRTGLAMGADRAILLETPENPEPLGVAKTLVALVKRENPNLVLLGKQAIDDDLGTTGQILAALLNWAQGTFASKITFVNEQLLEVEREIDGGKETVALRFPAVITTDLHLNEPRYASLPNIMRARKKPIETIAVDTLGIDLSPHTEVIGISEPAPRKAGIMLNSVEVFIEKLLEEKGHL